MSKLRRAQQLGFSSCPLDGHTVRIRVGGVRNIDAEVRVDIVPVAHFSDLSGGYVAVVISAIRAMPLRAQSATRHRGSRSFRCVSVAGYLSERVKSTGFTTVADRLPQRQRSELRASNRKNRPGHAIPAAALRMRRTLGHMSRRRRFSVVTHLCHPQFPARHC